MNTEQILLAHEQEFKCVARAFVGHERILNRHTRSIKTLSSCHTKLAIAVILLGSGMIILNKQVADLNKKVESLKVDTTEGI